MQHFDEVKAVDILLIGIFIALVAAFAIQISAV